VPAIALLAPRPRVEERLLTAAFAARGFEATLLDAAALALPLAGAPPDLPALALDRMVATPAQATLGALLGVSGTVVVNRAATTRLLADRLALLRHLIAGNLPVPDTVVAFGEEAALAAVEVLGYPALLQSPQVEPRIPDALVTDRDVAEAALEHRVTLGHETLVLAQRDVPGERLRVVVVEMAVVAVELLAYREDGAVAYAPYEGYATRLEALASAVVARLGSGIYQITVVLTDDGPIVTGASNLVDFRSLRDAGVDIAGQIAEFALAQWEARIDG
jgi:[lysine-biosynthesis-protein LysW]--L-2-aminoadipate ligase